MGRDLRGATIGLQISHREGANFLWVLYGLDMGILYLEKRARNASRVGPRMDLLRMLPVLGHDRPSSSKSNRNMRSCHALMNNLAKSRTLSLPLNLFAL